MTDLVTFARPLNSQLSSWLWNVPREIRQPIFEELLYSANPLCYDPRGLPYFSRGTNCFRFTPAILRTCQHAYHEGIEILYHLNHLLIDLQMGKTQLDRYVAILDQSYKVHNNARPQSPMNLFEHPKYSDGIDFNFITRFQRFSIGTSTAFWHSHYPGSCHLEPFRSFSWCQIELDLSGLLNAAWSLQRLLRDKYVHLCITDPGGGLPKPLFSNTECETYCHTSSMLVLHGFASLRCRRLSVDGMPDQQVQDIQQSILNGSQPLGHGPSIEVLYSMLWRAYPFLTTEQIEKAGKHFATVMEAAMLDKATLCESLAFPLWTFCRHYREVEDSWMIKHGKMEEEASWCISEERQAKMAFAATMPFQVNDLDAFFDVREQELNMFNFT